MWARRRIVLPGAYTPRDLMPMNLFSTMSIRPMPCRRPICERPRARVTWLRRTFHARQAMLARPACLVQVQKRGSGARMSAKPSPCSARARAARPLVALQAQGSGDAARTASAHAATLVAAYADSRRVRHGGRVRCQLVHVRRRARGGVPEDAGLVADVVQVPLCPRLSIVRATGCPSPSAYLRRRG